MRACGLLQLESLRAQGTDAFTRCHSAFLHSGLACAVSSLAGEIEDAHMGRRMAANLPWDISLGFLDWDVAQTLSYQDAMLSEQLNRLSSGSLGRSLLGNRTITSAKGLREAVPLSDYDAYKDTLGARRSDVLGEQPADWLVTSGRSDGLPKWVPLTADARSQLAKATLGLFIAATARERGEVRLPSSLRLLNMTAPPPYMSGTAVAAFADSRLWPHRLFPPNDPTTDALPFESRMALGFDTASKEGVDFAMSYSSVLAGIGASFARRQLPFSHSAGAEAHEEVMLPKDLWNLQGIIAGGMDARLFRRQIEEQWGCDPLELLGSTECLFYGMQTWDRSTITLIPHFNYFEFIRSGDLDLPGSDLRQPSTLKLDELSVNEVYELVVTNLLGGALVRYRTGELLKLTALSNAASGVQLPQFEYFGQRTDLIELAGFARLSETVIERAIASSNLPYVEWIAAKEVDRGQPVLHLRIELAGQTFVEAEVESLIDSALRRLDTDWRDLEDIVGVRPLRVSLLATGSFAHYRETVTTKPIPRINAPVTAVERLDRAASARRAQ
jgi:hypothetical protein